ncbi:tail length tape measure protein H [Stenotrophomonas phage CUB19]|nr:tail length tape measure protein H [Stenotrophomonas phage CUB19]
MANFAQLGIQIDSKQAEDAARDLDDLAAAGARAEKATDKLSKTTTDWAAEQQKANARAREMEQADARRAASAQKANSTIQDQQRELAKLIGQIDPAVAALGRLDEQERKLAQFRRQGLVDTDTFQKYNAQLQQQRGLLSSVGGAAERAGMSQRQYANNLRITSMQLTDITTGLLTGQPLYMVALQQGGQLRDIWGGLGNAARALATSIGSMINPFTLAAAAVGAIGVAFYQASSRTEEINEALISTGRNATYTADGIKQLADSIDSASGVTQGRAITAITALATTTQLSGDALTSAAAAATQWASVTGQSADTVVDKFRQIAKDPVGALTKLNEAEQFLTQTQYERIKALQDEGRWQEAATEAAKLYADVVAGRAREVESNLGLISTAWMNIKRASSEAWDGVVSGVDRAMGPLQRYADYLAKIGGAQRALSATGIGLLNPIAGAATYFGGNANRGRPEVIMPGIDGETRTPEAIRNESEQKRIEDRTRALAEWTATADKAASRQNTLNQLEKQGRDLGQSQAEINKVLNRQRDEWAKQDEKRAASSTKAAQADDNAARRMLDSAMRQITANTELAESGDKVTASRRLEIQIEQLLAKEKNNMTAATRAELQAAKESLAVTDAQAKARQQLTRDTAANAALTERLAQVYKQQQDQNEVSLLGIGRGSQASELLQRQLNLRRDYLSEVEKLDRAQRNKNTALSEEEYAREKALLEKSLTDRLALEQAFQQERQAAMGDWRNGANAAWEDFSANTRNVAGQTQNLFASAFEGATDALTKFVTTGKANFKEFTASILSDLAKIYARQALVGLVGSIAGSIGGAASSSTQLGNNFTWRQQTYGWSSGGYTGDGGKHTPAGIVHRGEVVWSQADVKAVGGPSRANAMRPTAGYATGGIVGGGASSSTNNASPTFEININMEGGTVSSQTQSGNAGQDAMQLVNMVKATCSQWWVEQNRTGGAVYKTLRGVG